MQPWSDAACAAESTVRCAFEWARSPAPPSLSKPRCSRPRSRSEPASDRAAICRTHRPCRAPRSSARRARRSTDDRDIPNAGRSHARPNKFVNHDAGKYCGRRVNRRRDRAGPLRDIRRSARSGSCRDSALRSRAPRTANRGTKSSPDRLGSPPGCSRNLFRGRSRDCVPAIGSAGYRAQSWWDPDFQTTIRYQYSAANQCPEATLFKKYTTAICAHEVLAHADSSRGGRDIARVATLSALVADLALGARRVPELHAVALREMRRRLKSARRGDIHDGHGGLQQQLARAPQAHLEVVVLGYAIQIALEQALDLPAR